MIRHQFIMYDIRSNKWRGKLCKYLKDKECIHLQKSIWMSINTQRQTKEIVNWIKDSIIPYLIPSDQLHIWPILKSSLSKRIILKSTLNFSFLDEDMDIISF